MGEGTADGSISSEPVITSNSSEVGDHNNNNDSNHNNNNGGADPAEARKRRKAIITSQRHEDALANESSSVDSTPSKRRKSDSSSKKTQMRYDPEVPMNKEQLAVWRREARRVRNRESAAASRQRIRNRISELETEVEDWKTKYDEAMDKLKQLERQAANKAAPSSSESNKAATAT